MTEKKRFTAQELNKNDFAKEEGTAKVFKAAAGIAGAAYVLKKCIPF